MFMPDYILEGDPELRKERAEDLAKDPSKDAVRVAVDEPEPPFVLDALRQISSISTDSHCVRFYVCFIMQQPSWSKEPLLGEVLFGHASFEAKLDKVHPSRDATTMKLPLDFLQATAPSMMSDVDRATGKSSHSNVAHLIAGVWAFGFAFIGNAPGTSHPTAKNLKVLVNLTLF